MQNLRISEWWRCLPVYSFFPEVRGSHGLSIHDERRPRSVLVGVAAHRVGQGYWFRIRLFDRSPKVRQPMELFIAGFVFGVLIGAILEYLINGR